MTSVISFYAGPGSGKSTTAAELFVELKKRGKKVELVQEYVKGWAWEEKTIKPVDQLYLLAKQFKAESKLYGKVDYVVTDSPVYLSFMYDYIYQGSDALLGVTSEMLRRASTEHRILRYNYFIERDKPYFKHGRYETEEQARERDEQIKYLLGAFVCCGYETIKTGQTKPILERLGLHNVDTVY